MTEPKPLLSICVPTYNRSKFLRVMLQALLPQVADCGDQVEVWVIDNGSPDDTPAVVEQSRALGPFRSVRNAENLGPVKNVVMGPAELATGEFVWVLGDHNLLMPGALQRVLRDLGLQRELDLFYVNFRCATYPDHWPNCAHSGYAGPCSYIGNLDIHESRVPQWSDLIKPSSALCTQIYAHVVRTRIWRDYWHGRKIAEPYTSGETTYPHTWTIVATCFSKSAGCIAEPLITIFNGAQSWSNPGTQRLVLLRGLPNLIRFFSTLGLTSVRLLEARDFNQRCVYAGLLESFRAVGQDNARVAVSSLWIAGFRSCYLWKPIITAYFDSRSSMVSRSYWRIKESVKHLHDYVFRNSRPARWLRGGR